jgi:hypothetical protein
MDSDRQLVDAMPKQTDDQHEYQNANPQYSQHDSVNHGKRSCIVWVAHIPAAITLTNHTAGIAIIQYIL